MRHAAPHATANRKLSRAAQIALGAATYTIAGLSACAITLTVTFALWSLWQLLGVN